MNCYASMSSIISVHSDGRYVKDGRTLRFMAPLMSISDELVGCGLHRRTVDTIVAINLLNNCCGFVCKKTV